MSQHISKDMRSAALASLVAIEKELVTIRAVLRQEDEPLPLAEKDQDSFERRFNAVAALVGDFNRVAEICGVTRATSYRWRKSEAKMPLDAAVALIRAANVSLEWFATGCVSMRDEK